MGNFDDMKQLTEHFIAEAKDLLKTHAVTGMAHAQDYIEGMFSKVDVDHLQPMVVADVVNDDGTLTEIICPVMGLPEDNHSGFFHQMGKALSAAQEGKMLLSVTFMSEAWMKHIAKDAEVDWNKKVSEYPDKQECITINIFVPLADITLFAAYPVRREENNIIRLEKEIDTKDTTSVESNILKWFVNGYMQELRTSSKTAQELAETMKAWHVKQKEHLKKILQ